jgi:hypothetical protein
MAAVDGDFSYGCNCAIDAVEVLFENMVRGPELSYSSVLGM